MGGYARRTTSTGLFSNHSTGCAIDINYNMDTRQNHHFHTEDENPHLVFVETVVRTHPDHASFDIKRARGQEAGVVTHGASWGTRGTRRSMGGARTRRRSWVMSMLAVRCV